MLDRQSLDHALWLTLTKGRQAKAADRWLLLNIKRIRLIILKSTGRA
jgi:hypothetical protein